VLLEELAVVVVEDILPTEELLTGELQEAQVALML
jgi:hypothetical protein